MRYKKFDGSLKSSNQPTQQVREFRSQEPLPGIKSICNLEAGYVLNELQTEISSIHIVCPNGEKPYWDIEIRDENISAVITDMFDASQEIESNEDEPAIYRSKDSGIILPFKRDETESE